MSKVMPVRNGMLKILSYEETQVLIDRLGPKVSHRRLYIKLACLAVLKYDAEGRYLNSSQISELGSKYLAKTVGLTGQTVGTVLGILSRYGVVSRSNNRPHMYWWREQDED